jgi:hypothetical protein
MAWNASGGEQETTRGVTVQTATKAEVRKAEFPPDKPIE